MRHRVAGRKLDRPTEHRLALYRNQVAELIDHEKMVTTVAKAKEVKGLAERIITLGKEGSLASRRHAQEFVWSRRCSMTSRGATPPGPAGTSGWCALASVVAMRPRWRSLSSWSR